LSQDTYNQSIYELSSSPAHTASPRRQCKLRLICTLGFAVGLSLPACCCLGLSVLSFDLCLRFLSCLTKTAFTRRRSIDPSLGASLAEMSVNSCLVLRCLVLSFVVLSCPSLSCLVLRCLVLSFVILSCFVLCYLVLALSCPVLSCLVVSCHHIVSCLALSSLVLALVFVLMSCLVLSCLGLGLCPYVLSCPFLSWPWSLSLCRLCRLCLLPISCCFFLSLFVCLLYCLSL
jgi:hypothetical protein